MLLSNSDSFSKNSLIHRNIYKLKIFWFFSRWHRLWLKLSESLSFSRIPLRLLDSFSFLSGVQHMFIIYIKLTIKLIICSIKVFWNIVPNVVIIFVFFIDLIFVLNIDLIFVLNIGLVFVFIFVFNFVFSFVFIIILIDNIIISTIDVQFFIIIILHICPPPFIIILIFSAYSVILSCKAQQERNKSFLHMWSTRLMLILRLWPNSSFKYIYTTLSRFI